MLLNDLKNQLDQAARAWSEAQSNYNGELQATRALLNELSELRRKNEFVKALEVERDLLPIQKAKEQEAEARLNQELLKMRELDHRFAYERDQALRLQAQIETLKHRLGPGGFFEHHINLHQQRLASFEGQRAGEEKRLEELCAKLHGMTDAPDDLKDYRRHPALTR